MIVNRTATKASRYLDLIRSRACSFCYAPADEPHHAFKRLRGISEAGCGYGVWNARNKEGRERPPSEWVIVPNARPALITEDEARAIVAARRRAQGTATIPTIRGRILTSEYLLSGGLFLCGRCNANIIGFRTSSGEYYVMWQPAIP